MVITEKEENILMLYEELEHYMRLFNLEKFNHNNLINEFNILEKKIYKIEEENHKEKQMKKNEVNDNKKIELLSPKHYKQDDNFGSPSATNFSKNNNS